MTNKLYTPEDFEKMVKLKKEFEEIGEGERFTVKRIQIRLRVGNERATQLFNDIMKAD